MKINLIVDLQYGSTGKGLLAGYLAEKDQPDVIVTCNMPNAGHTYIDSNGNKMIFKVLPNGGISEACEFIMIGPGAVFDIDRLIQEIRELAAIKGTHGFTVAVHPNATVLTDFHKETEAGSLSVISSTMQGSGVASIHKMARQPDDNPTVGANPHVMPTNIAGVQVVVPSHSEWMEILSDSRLIQAEGSQGFSLGVNQRFYPFCTSRECTPHRMLSDMGLPMLPEGLTVWGTLRTYPIRVGNTPDGYSGDWYCDQAEVGWDSFPGVVPELTTVTKRVRRIATFSREQLREALWHCRPNHLFLNFCNYMNESQLGGLVEGIEQDLQQYPGTDLALMGYGPTFYDVRSYNPGQA